MEKKSTPRIFYNELFCAEFFKKIKLEDLEIETSPSEDSLKKIEIEEYFALFNVNLSNIYKARENFLEEFKKISEKDNIKKFQQKFDEKSPLLYFSKITDFELLLSTYSLSCFKEPKVFFEFLSENKYKSSFSFFSDILFFGFDKFVLRIYNFLGKEYFNALTELEIIDETNFNSVKVIIIESFSSFCPDFMAEKYFKIINFCLDKNEKCYLSYDYLFKGQTQNSLLDFIIICQSGFNDNNIVYNLLVKDKFDYTLQFILYKYFEYQVLKDKKENLLDIIEEQSEIIIKTNKKIKKIFIHFILSLFDNNIYEHSDCISKILFIRVNEYKEIYIPAFIEHFKDKFNNNTIKDNLTMVAKYQRFFQEFNEIAKKGVYESLKLFFLEQINWHLIIDLNCYDDYNKIFESLNLDKDFLDKDFLNKVQKIYNDKKLKIDIKYYESNKSKIDEELLLAFEDPSEESKSISKSKSKSKKKSVISNSKKKSEESETKKETNLYVEEEKKLNEFKNTILSKYENNIKNFINGKELKPVDEFYCKTNLCGKLAIQFFPEQKIHGLFPDDKFFVTRESEKMEIITYIPNSINFGNNFDNFKNSYSSSYKNDIRGFLFHEYNHHGIYSKLNFKDYFETIKTVSEEPLHLIKDIYRLYDSIRNQINKSPEWQTKWLDSYISIISDIFSKVGGKLKKPEGMEELHLDIYFQNSKWDLKYKKIDGKRSRKKIGKSFKKRSRKKIGKSFKKRSRKNIRKSLKKRSRKNLK